MRWCYCWGPSCLSCLLGYLVMEQYLGLDDAQISPLVYWVLTCLDLQQRLGCLQLSWMPTGKKWKIWNVKHMTIWSGIKQVSCMQNWRHKWYQSAYNKVCTILCIILCQHPHKKTFLTTPASTLTSVTIDVSKDATHKHYIECKFTI